MLYYNNKSCNAYLDSIYKHLEQIDVDEDVIDELKTFIDFEEFDTQSLSMDIIDDDYQHHL